MLKFTILIAILVMFNLCVETLADQNSDAPPIHFVQKGDTFESIASRYDTCVGSIIWENGLVRAGFYSSQFIVKAGTILHIPQRSECDDLPTGEYIHVVEHGDTILGLMTRYCSRVSGSWLSPLEIGDHVTVSRVENAYQIEHQEIDYDHCVGNDHLVVYGDNDRIFYTNEVFHIEDIADCYGISSASIISANPGEMVDGRPFFSVGLSRSFVIPDVTKECMIYEGLTTNISGDQVINQTYACYPQPIEQMAALPPSDIASLHFREETGDFCYTLEQAYTLLLDPLDLDWFKWGGQVMSWESDNWRQESIDGREWENLARCIGTTIEEIRDANSEIPYSSEVFPPLPIRYPIYYIVPKPRRPCYLFEQELLQTQHIHIVEHGESLSTIAAQYDLFTISLAQANGIESWSQIYQGEWLLIPNHPTRSEITLFVTLASSTFLLMPTIITLYRRKSNVT